LKKTDYSNHLKNLAKTSNERLVLPESRDNRIQDASKSLEISGIKLVTAADYYHLKEDYAELISRKKFTRNWPEELIAEFLEDPVNWAAVMVHAGDADAIVAGVSAHREIILRSLIRILGVNRKFKFVFSSTILVNPENDRLLSFSEKNLLMKIRMLSSQWSAINL